MWSLCERPKRRQCWGRVRRKEKDKRHDMMRAEESVFVCKPSTKHRTSWMVWLGRSLDRMPRYTRRKYNEEYNAMIYGMSHPINVFITVSSMPWTPSQCNVLTFGPRSVRARTSFSLRRSISHNTFSISLSHSFEPLNVDLGIYRRND